MTPILWRNMQRRKQVAVVVCVGLVLLVLVIASAINWRIYPPEWEAPLQRTRVWLGWDEPVKFTINLQARGCYLVDPDGVRYMVDADVTQVPLAKGWKLTRECFRIERGAFLAPSAGSK